MGARDRVLHLRNYELHATWTCTQTCTIRLLTKKRLAARRDPRCSRFGFRSAHIITALPYQLMTHLLLLSLGALRSRSAARTGRAEGKFSQRLDLTARRGRYAELYYCRLSRARFRLGRAGAAWPIPSLLAAGLFPGVNLAFWGHLTPQYTTLYTRADAAAGGLRDF